MHRARKDLDDAFPGENVGRRVIEGDKKEGYRIGPDFEVRGFSLQAELGAYKPRRRAT